MSEERITLHLAPIDVWQSQAGAEQYEPEAFAREGFIHCTDGEQRLIEVGNRYYASDPRRFCCLSLDRTRIAARVIYEDPEQVYPHIYGPLNVDAIVEVREVLRADDGTFVGIGGSLTGA